jgi:serpin B
MDIGTRRVAALGLALVLGGSGLPVAVAGEDGVKSVAESNNRFALDLYAELAGGDPARNLFFSPSSISTALAMTLTGARGTTAEEMRQTLRFTLEDAALHGAMADLTARLGSTGEGMELSIANALWGQRGFEFLPEFLELNREHYGAGLRLVDFVGATEPARQEINGWVAEETRDKIPELIPPGLLDAATRLVLTNAIYFKGTWKLQFDPELTRDMPFLVSADREVTVPMMSMRSPEFPYFEGNGVQALELPYVGERTSMVLLLPDETTGLDAFESKLDAESLESMLGEMRSRELQSVQLPRFTMTRKFRLEETLGRMGMPAAFGAGADFSGMTGRRDLFISNVVHEAFVQVNEEGTEAAAATGVVMKRTAYVPKPVFRADRPFIFLIRDDDTGAILFMGRVVDPSVKS